MPGSERRTKWPAARWTLAELARAALALDFLEQGEARHLAGRDLAGHASRGLLGLDDVAEAGLARHQVAGERGRQHVHLRARHALLRVGPLGKHPGGLGGLV